ncbi:MAG: hypothetical protein F6K42_39165 [Leptolyngbya sp. SIO1D8]|nr:hypothetical protein [Leptolyngbya sp. SIO1D8]
MTDKIVPVALRLWLLFLFAFLLLGYAIIPSILFGAIGGFAGGMVSAWWQTPGGEPEKEFEPSALERIGGRLRPRQVQNRLPFLKLFTRRDRRYPKSRRS